MGPVIQKCIYCGTRYDRDQWKALRLVGNQRVPANATEQPKDLEIRNCLACDNSIAIDLLAPGTTDKDSKP